MFELMDSHTKDPVIKVIGVGGGGGNAVQHMVTAGIEGVDAHDDGAAIAETQGLGIGALAVGNVKYQVEAGLFRRMIESEGPLALDFRDAFALARENLG